MVAPIPAVCPCCHQTLPEPDNYGLKLTSTQSLLLQAVQKAGEHGIHSESLFAKVYGIRYDGGPDTGIKVIHVHVHHVNQKLASVGRRIRGQRDRQIYKLEEVG